MLRREIDGASTFFFLLKKKIGNAASAKFDFFDLPQFSREFLKKIGNTAPFPCVQTPIIHIKMKKTNEQVDKQCKHLEHTTNLLLASCQSVWIKETFGWHLPLAKSVFHEARSGRWWRSLGCNRSKMHSLFYWNISTGGATQKWQKQRGGGHRWCQCRCKLSDHETVDDRWPSVGAEHINQPANNNQHPNRRQGGGHFVGWKQPKEKLEDKRTNKQTRQPLATNANTHTHTHTRNMKDKNRRKNWIFVSAIIHLLDDLRDRERHLSSNIIGANNATLRQW